MIRRKRDEASSPSTSSMVSDGMNSSRSRERRKGLTTTTSAKKHLWMLRQVAHVVVYLVAMIGAQHVIESLMMVHHHEEMVMARRASEMPSPGMVQIAGDDTLHNVSRAVPAPDIRVEEEHKDNESDVLNWLGPEWSDQFCIPIGKWQLPQYSPFSCQIMHELDLDPVTGLQIINCGGSRCAFRIQGVVLKTFKYYNADVSSIYDTDKAWRDSILMERLSSSPYVLDIYANCGIAQITELASGGNLHDQMKIARQAGIDSMSPLTRLKIGHQVASAVADMHSIDNSPIPSVSHNDLCCHQFILVDGVYKLNDFHLASALTVSRTGEPCEDIPASMSRTLAKTRSPEELLSRTRANRMIHRDKADVWLMGNILYYVLTKKWLFEGMTRDEATESIMNGKQSPIPSELVSSDNDADKALIKAIQMAWVFDPSQRPTARQIADYLQQQLEVIDKQNGLVVPVRVSIPPLPPDHRYTDTDFYENLKA